MIKKFQINIIFYEGREMVKMNKEAKKPEKSESLDEYLTRLISEKEGIKREEVTVEYMHQQRMNKIYPKAKFEIGSDYGGYDTTGLAVYSRDELDDIEKSVDKELKKITSQK